jgi:hypothetical protein
MEIHPWEVEIGNTGKQRLIVAFIYGWSTHIRRIGRLPYKHHTHKIWNPGYLGSLI